MGGEIDCHLIHKFASAQKGMKLHKYTKISCPFSYNWIWNSLQCMSHSRVSVENMLVVNNKKPLCNSSHIWLIHKTFACSQYYPHVTHEETEIWITQQLGDSNPGSQVGCRWEGCWKRMLLSLIQKSLGWLAESRTRGGVGHGIASFW